MEMASNADSIRCWLHRPGFSYRFAILIILHLKRDLIIFYFIKIFIDIIM